MTNERSTEERISRWLSETAARELPDRTLDATFSRTRSMSQVSAGRPWRDISMRPIAMFATGAVAIALIAVVGTVGLGLLPGSGGVGGATMPTPRPMPTAAPTVTPSPTPKPSARRSAIGTATWLPFTSARYGFQMGYPTDWTAHASDHDWTFAGDATNWLSSGEEVFMAPDNAIRVAAWAVPLDPGTELGGPELEAWITQYCEATKTGPCTGIHERAVTMCLEKRDCHLAMLVPFQDDIQAFFQSVEHPDQLVIVAIGWGESAPATAAYGGSQRLLEGFLSTINVWPAPPTSAP